MSILKCKNKTINGPLEQIYENAVRIEEHYQMDRVLADFGITIIGRLDSWPTPEPVAPENYGDAYIVGTEAPYSFYIWTRAGLNAEVDYWFPLGQLAVVGPEGPIGPEGPQGPRGESTRWYVTETNTVSASSASPYDMYLIASTGNIYECTLLADGITKVWILKGNIRGPQGIQGPIGPQGVQGPIGPQGPKGDTGDVGGFINIFGILNNVNQLPTPESLANLSVAYLVGTAEPYTLWIQIGETSETAIWTDVGPFNAATLVFVNGSAQNVWDADTKLDKVTATTSYQQVYSKFPNGTQTMMNVSAAVAPSTIVQRTGNSSIKCAYAVHDDEAVSRAQADGRYVAKSEVAVGETANSIAKRDANGRLYGVCTATSGDATLVSKGYADDTYVPKSDVEVSASGNKIVRRAGSGNIQVPITPGSNEHATSKGYVSTWIDIPFTADKFTNPNGNGAIILREFTARYNPAIRQIIFSGRVDISSSTAFTDRVTAVGDLSYLKEQLGVDTLPTKVLVPNILTAIVGNSTQYYEGGYFALGDDTFEVAVFETSNYHREAGTYRIGASAVINY